MIGENRPITSTLPNRARIDMLNLAQGATCQDFDSQTRKQCQEKLYQLIHDTYKEPTQGAEA